MPDEPINFTVELTSDEVKCKIDFGNKTPAEHLEKSIPGLLALFKGTSETEFRASLSQG